MSCHLKLVRKIWFDSQSFSSVTLIFTNVANERVKLEAKWRDDFRKKATRSSGKKLKKLFKWVCFKSNTVFYFWFFSANVSESLDYLLSPWSQEFRKKWILISWWKYIYIYESIMNWTESIKAHEKLLKYDCLKTITYTR